MRIATWNINSVRIRIPLLKKLVEKENPDIVCLQETKVVDELFPLQSIKELGFEHVLFRGQKSYNGMAILSKAPLTALDSIRFGDSDDKRHIAARLPDGTAIHNFYVPAGGDIPDPKENPAYGFKLRFVEDMTDWAKQVKKSKENTVIVGDFNIAPLPNDVWSHKQLLKVVSHTPPEIERLDALKDTLHWCDVGRHYVPEEEKLYSWWSYRNRDWKKSNRGRRLDHIWVTPELTGALKRYHVLQEARDWESPSDHVPLLANIKLVA